VWYGRLAVRKAIFNIIRPARDMIPAHRRGSRQRWQAVETHELHRILDDETRRACIPLAELPGLGPS
jgi:hypothetical protein